MTVYFVRPVGERGPVKIGHSFNPIERLSTLMAWSPIPLEIAATIAGGPGLEARFHALFKHQHSHREWFRASDELDSVIAQIRAGAFDVRSLPTKGLRLWEMSEAAREGHEAQSYTMRLSIMIKRGVEVPPEVSGCLYGPVRSEYEKRSRRATIKAFVDSASPQPERSAA